MGNIRQEIERDDQQYPKLRPISKLVQSYLALSWGHACCQLTAFTSSLFSLRTFLPPQLDFTHSLCHLVSAPTSDSEYQAFLIIFSNQKRIICKGKQNYFLHKQPSFIQHFDFIFMFASRNYSDIYIGITGIPNAIVKSEGKKTQKVLTLIKKILSPESHQYYPCLRNRHNPLSHDTKE